MRTVMLLALCLVAVAAQPTNDAALRIVSAAGSRFSNAFFRYVGEEKPGNLITSPLSASIVLTMAASGAGGKTKQDMMRSLDLPNNDALVQTGYQQLVDILNNVKDVKLSVANKIFAHKHLSVKQSYKELTKTYFRSAAQEVDFSNGNAAAKIINDWVKANTNNLIQEIVKADSLSDSTGLVLANAIYFKGQWKSKFNKKFTEDSPFHVDAQTVKKVPTMFQRSEYNYVNAPELNAQIVELPYVGDKISMVIVLPNEVDGLGQLEQKIYRHDLNNILKGASKEQVQLFLPKFKIESTIDLESALTKMGMGVMFGDSANFNGISDSPLYVSKVIQKAYVEVNEEGSEAAGATESELENRMGGGYKYFNVNRPFLFSIVYAAGTSHAQVLFRGHVNHPKLA